MATSIHPGLRPSYTISHTSAVVSSSPFSPSTTSSSRSRPSYDGRTVSGKVRRLTLDVDDAAQQRRADHDRSDSPASEGPVPQRPARPTSRVGSSNRNSWVKRMSWTMSSRSASPVSTEGGRLSALSHSYDLSNPDSSSPMVGSRPSTQSGPNKLVKRPSSRLLSASGAPSNTKHLTLRRPATSHQRAAAMLQQQQHHQQQQQQQEQARISTVLPDTASPVTDSGDEGIRWRQFFTVKLGRSGSSKQKRTSSRENAAFKRILPDDRYMPTLISAKTVLTSSFDIDDTLSQDDASLNSSSRPGTGYGLGLHTQPQPSIEPGSNIDQQPTGTSLHPSPQPHGPEEVTASAPRRSFSLQDLLSRGPSSRKPSRRPSKKLVKRSSRRVSSEASSVHEREVSAPGRERPSKRRDITDPRIFRKDGGATPGCAQQERANLTATTGTSASSPSTFTSEPHFQSGDTSPNMPHHNSFNSHSKPYHLSNPPSLSHSPILSHGPFRASNVSTTSEQTSTVVSSDNETSRGFNSVDDEDTDRSTLFDSLRTRGTRSTSGAHRGRIETIFDESPSPPLSKGSKLRDILPAGMLTRPDFASKDHHSTIEEEDSITTPVRTVRSDRADDGSPTVTRIRNRTPLPLHLKSPHMTKALSLGTLEYDDNPVEEDDESRWSAFDDDSRHSLDEDWNAVGDEQTSTPKAGHRAKPKLTAASSASSTTTAHADIDSLGRDNRREARSHIFDWSELPPEKSPGNCSPPRPRTVHGKKDTDRGSRPSRRAPSALHARSQSVPVVPDLAGKRETVMTNKFGTWGVGSKGVSEDWDDDFDFEDNRLPEGKTFAGDREEKRIDSGVAMHIPQTIRDQQAKVVSNIGLVREFGLLIEELKLLRTRVAEQGLLGTSKSSLWQEMDAMIDLADQEVDDPILPTRPSRSSSPLPDFDGFDDPSESLPSAPTKQAVTPLPHRSRSRRRSVLPAESDVFNTPKSQTASPFLPTSSPPSISLSGRPRKDSEAVARSVIEALQQRKETAAGIPLQPVPANKKVPFDTTTLRHIVPYVSSLVRQVKESLKDSHDNIDESKNANVAPSTAEQPLSQLFKQPTKNNTPSRRPRHTSPSDDDDDSDDLDRQMNKMNIM